MWKEEAEELAERLVNIENELSGLIDDLLDAIEGMDGDLYEIIKERCEDLGVCQ